MTFPASPRVVITGAGSGLGRAFALRLAGQNARVLVTDVDLDGARDTAAQVAHLGGTAEVLAVDVTVSADLERAAARADTLWGGTDLLINNAGVSIAGQVGEVSLEDWEWALRINLWGVIHGCHTFVPRMKAAHGGFILNVASNAGIASLPEMGPYNVSKAAVISLSETLHAELGPFGVRVSVVCPTFFRSNLMKSLRTSTDRQRQLANALFARSSVTADTIAAAGLVGLEKGRCIVVPRLDAKVVWWFKRFLPGLFHWILRRQPWSGRAARWLLKADNTEPQPELRR